MGQRVLLGLSAVALLGLVVTLDRAPAREPDTQLYGSIARAVQLWGDGLPTSLRMSPKAVDHLPFYGPVYFYAAATVFDTLGVSKASIRLISLAGALLVVGAGALLARQLSDAPHAALWAAALLLLAPDLRTSATNGSMQTLAVGLELAGLAVWVRGALSASRPAWHGALAGMLLGAAALTTPRTFPFIAAFFASAALLTLAGPRRDHAPRWALASALATCALVVGAWAVSSHGSPADWARYMAFIFTHEDTDISFVPGERIWHPGRTGVVTTIVAMAGALVVAWAVDRQRRAGLRDPRWRALSVVLVTSWTSCVLMIAGMNRTFESGIYVSVPLLAAVLAAPRQQLRIPPRLVRAFAAVTLGAFIAVAGLKAVRVIGSWSARDPLALVSFISEHLQPGDVVIGPGTRYFFAVERTGAIYRSAYPDSFADWARWVPAVDPDAVDPVQCRETRLAEGSHRRFLLWPLDEPLPRGFRCAGGHAIGRFTPAPDDFDLPEFLESRDPEPGATLFALPEGCPTGYDPSGVPAADCPES